MHRMRHTHIAITLLLLVVSGKRAESQTLFSYIDESGTRVMTNIPPKVPMQQPTAAAPPPPARETADAPVPSPSKRFDPIIEKYATQYKLDPSLIRSIIATESGFNERAVSPKGARGLMQLMPATAARVGVRNALDPEQNIRGGTLHMRTLLDTFNNDLPLSLAAYNAGENLVQRLGRIPSIRETHDYVRSVTQKYGRTEMPMGPEVSAPIPAMFRFLDDEGVLHLTNIPPIQRFDSDVSSSFAR